MNLLHLESSPYLLQHADNPVHWKPWGETAFEIAKMENKPVLVSIGYSSCHWCHVMEHESFEDQETADLMNKLFINIKVDREELPDVDHIYMDAVQAMTGSGGWPLNVFLTPDKKAFYGGTYFPPVRAHGRASWKEVLINVSQYFSQNRTDVEAQAQKLLAHIKQGSLMNPSDHIEKKNEEDASEICRLICRKMMTNADLEEGGFGMAPKFPSTFAIHFLLDAYALYKDEKALQHALLSLDKMMMGGIYDQVGGGFARYSTDRFWIAPHFEKMLYDNALLIEVYAIAYSITKKTEYHQVILETVNWLKREMMNEEYGFYSAQDADSEGIEGKYYTWSYDELNKILQDDFQWFAEYYHVTKEGNWEHSNILYATVESVSALHETQRVKLPGLHQKLLNIRLKRIKPLTDDKELLAWNALMNKALSAAYLHTGDTGLLELAEKNMNYILRTFYAEDHLYYHTCRNHVLKIPAYADDLAYLADALIALARVTTETMYLDKATKIADYMNSNFSEEGNSLYLFTNKSFQQVEINKREMYDGALPSSNAVMCRVLNYLYHVYWQEEYRNRSEEMLLSMQHSMLKYPLSFAVWCAQLQFQSDASAEVCIVGKDAKNIFQQLYTKQYQASVTYLTTHKENTIVSMKGKYQDGETLIYICNNFSCQEPLRDVNHAFIEISKFML